MEPGFFIHNLDKFWTILIKSRMSGAGEKERTEKIEKIQAHPWLLLALPKIQVG